MREVLYRGRRVDNGEWVYGYYYKIPAPPVCLKEDEKVVRDEHFIVFERPNYVPDWGMPRQMVQAEVDSKTIGQWTGLTDETGIKIFEDDIINYLGKNYIIKWHCSFAAFVYDPVIRPKIPKLTWQYMDNIYFASEPKRRNPRGVCDVIGNIYDNPELLKSVNE